MVSPVESKCEMAQYGFPHTAHYIVTKTTGPKQERMTVCKHHIAPVLQTYTDMTYDVHSTPCVTTIQKIV